ncbi:MAG: chemotaxis protein [Thermodesulfovibrio sp.]|nr:chemotaxis protein [Thermodesulfovibrio sp.]
MDQKWKRRNYFIKKELQGQYIFTIFLFVIFGCLIFTFIFSRLAADTMTITYENSVLQVGKTPIVLARELLKANWIFILTGGFFIGFLALFVTHRFAGPLFRFEKTLDAMIREDHSSVIRLRPNDEAKEVAELLNQYNDKISADLAELRKESEAVGEQLKAAAGADDPAVVRALLAEATGRTEKLITRLRNYKLKNDC